MSVIPSLWTLFGLTGDPYFQDPLTPDVDADSPRSTDRFVGRERELALASGQVAGTDAAGNSRTVVEGAPGVGKTSFVNRVKTVLAGARQPVVLTHAQPVRVQEGMTPRAFAGDVLRTLLLIHEEAPAVPEPANAEPFWRRVRRIVHGEDTISGGLNVVGVGGSVQVNRIAAEKRDGALYDDVARAFALLAGPHRSPRQRRVLIHVNNMENLAADATTHAARLMQNLRDYFLVPYSHWIFVGATGIDAAVFRAAPQVSGIMPPPLVLGPLSAADVSEALHRRYRALRRGRGFVPPVASEAVLVLYERYGGDLRNFLRVLSSGVRTAAIAPAAPLGVTEIVRGVALEYRRDLVRRIGEEGVARLEALARRHGPVTPFRATELVAAAGMRIEAATRLLDTLEAAGVVRPHHTRGRSVYFVLSGDATVAVGV